ncbi:putative monooxygenase [Saccharata proteae CBS 121410]|uniref:Monooxygenase n=1 Tax=Saccharata proteae CBS 121410 TaxID=1314787 RepID=A0A9P4M0I8_9PEZI|nr:putative monooxygenase [Saccharata proteae CBS 121410]
MAAINKDMHIAIIGAGMGGLAAALALARQGFTHIDVYEAASNLGFVGAGIQLAPNMARILDRLGCWAPVEAEATDIMETSIRQGDSNAELAHVDMPHIRQTYGYAHMVGHRSNLAGSIYEACKTQKNKISFFFATSADKINSFGPKPSFTAIPRKGGQPYTVTADVILAADGVKSVVRPQILHELGVDADVEDTGQAAYRIMLKREDMASDPEMLELIDSNRVTRWIGEKRHIIAYSVANKSIYNLSTVQPDTNFAAAPSATYTTKGDKKSMLDIFSDFCPLVQKMLNLVPDGEVCEWKLRVHSPLPTWVHGSVALVGDACHPTLPHLNQGAAQAIEDAAVLAVVLARCPSKYADDINKSLRVYEAVRKERATTLVGLASASGKGLHLGEGEAKKERDRQFAALKEKKGGSVPDKWADADVQRMIYGHDCAKVAEDEFDEIFKSLKTAREAKGVVPQL